ncbi:unnamed protein product [Arctia plantaginis]|uniref:Uncharacterized protein n=1 Tax=Arctia plantaginis TaxID=874455 RepID=A0A8S0YLT0_ARCPL|nr:unnamed protein product [Arctia plantaginis]
MVTGSVSEIGKAIAILYAKKGADVVTVRLTEEKAIKTREILNQYGNRVLVIKTDVSKDEETQNAIEKMIVEFGKLDIVCDMYPVS